MQDTDREHVSSREVPPPPAERVERAWQAYRNTPFGAILEDVVQVARQMGAPTQVPLPACTQAFARHFTADPRIRSGHGVWAPDQYARLVASMPTWAAYRTSKVVVSVASDFQAALRTQPWPMQASIDALPCLVACPILCLEGPEPAAVAARLDYLPGSDGPERHLVFAELDPDGFWVDGTGLDLGQPRLDAAAAAHNQRTPAGAQLIVADGTLWPARDGLLLNILLHLATQPALAPVPGSAPAKRRGGAALSPDRHAVQHIRLEGPAPARAQHAA